MAANAAIYWWIGGLSTVHRRIGRLSPFGKGVHCPSFQTFTDLP
jgi:hypothetical protein